MWTAAAGWLPWGAHAFARARSERCPVLLVLTARWCPHSAALGQTTLSDPRVRDLLERHFVAVRVDADRRPDIADRYGLGALPTLAVLTSEGEVLCGGTFVDADRLIALLPRVLDAYRRGEHLCAAPALAASTDDVSTAAPVAAALVDGIASGFDAAHGGWGTAPKFPVTAPVRLALALWREERSGWWREAAITTLDRMGWGPLFDPADGGFFRSAAAADWSRPDREKLLEVNASLLSLYVEAFETLQLVRYAERAADVAGFLQARLADPIDGGWAASHYRCQDSSRVSGDVDPTIFTSANAAAVSAALYAGEVLKDPALSEFAVRTLERVALTCHRPGAGVAHYAEPSSGGALAAGDVRGLLDDQVALSGACLDTFEATGNVVYRMLAEELLLYSLRTLWSEPAEAFTDRPSGPDDIGLLGERRIPFVGNCLAAGILHRLARVSAHGDFAAPGDRILAAMSRRAAAEGPMAAEFVLALRRAAR